MNKNQFINYFKQLFVFVAIVQVFLDIKVVIRNGTFPNVACIAIGRVTSVDME
jgi:hypothetical protein